MRKTCFLANFEKKIFLYNFFLSCSVSCVSFKANIRVKPPFKGNFWDFVARGVRNFLSLCLSFTFTFVSVIRMDNNTHSQPTTYASMPRPCRWIDRCTCIGGLSISLFSARTTHSFCPSLYWTANKRLFLWFFLSLSLSPSFPHSLIRSFPRFLPSFLGGEFAQPLQASQQARQSKTEQGRGNNTRSPPTN